MSEQTKRACAYFVAGHALAETRLGPPYATVSIVDGDPKWDAPERPLSIGSIEEAQSMLTRLRAGVLAAKAFVPEATAEADAWAAADLAMAQEVEDWIRSRGGEPVDPSASAAFMAEPANHEAIRLIAEEVLQTGSLSMEEVDFLVEAADGDDEALEGLARFRAVFTQDRIPWPDHT